MEVELHWQRELTGSVNQSQVAALVIAITASGVGCILHVHAP